MRDSQGELLEGQNEDKELAQQSAFQRRQASDGVDSDRGSSINGIRGVNWLYNLTYKKKLVRFSVCLACLFQFVHFSFFFNLKTEN